MRTILTGGIVVTGDGTSPLRADVSVRDGLIEGIESGVVGPGDAVTIDVTGCIVMPGGVNVHAHGVTPGPLFPSAAAPLDEASWLENLDRHLLGGTTTVLNLCGFASMDDVRRADAAHAVKVRGATTYLPSSIRAARAADGAGLPRADYSIEAMLDDGALAIGELGGGQTLGGGGQDLHYLPAAIAAETGVSVSSQQARALKEAVLGRHLERAAPDLPALTAALADAGLDHALSVRRASALIAETVMPSVRPALDGIREGVTAAAQFGVPVLVHTAAVTAALLRELSRIGAGGGRVIATHCNHPSFTVAEASVTTRELQAAGWLIECCTFDLLHGRKSVTTREHWDALMSDPDLVTVLGTDYGPDGRHDTLLAGAADLVRHGYRTLSEAIAMVTAGAAAAVPGLVPRGATLRRGAAADIAVCSVEDIADVRHVFVDGVHVVKEGTLSAGARR